MQARGEERKTGRAWVMNLNVKTDSAAPDQFLAVACFRLLAQQTLNKHEAQRKRGARQQAPPGFS